MTHNIALSGRLMVGKDFIADQLGHKVIGFTDVFRSIAIHTFGTADKSLPGMRSFMQKIGAWGRGEVSEKYPFTAERFAFTEMIRSRGLKLDLDPEMTSVNWQAFGRFESFWADIMASRVNAFKSMGVPLVVTGLRTELELNSLINVGFKHFHVRCSEETRQMRMLNRNYAPTEAELNDITEAMSIRWDTELPPHKIIWNDNVQIAGSEEFISVEDFLQDYKKHDNSQSISGLAQRV